MSDLVPHKKVLSRQGRIRRFKSKPEIITFMPDEEAKISFANGSVGGATCLGCHDAPCVELEVPQALEHIAMFPSDPVRDVCPTDAISWNTMEDIPTIDTESCIGCGICAVRCPYGAISLSPEGIAVVKSDDFDGITAPSQEIAKPHVKIVREGLLGSITGSFIQELPNVVENMNDTQKTRFVRNMFLMCGVMAHMRRKGDINIRMDGILQFESGQFGVVEIETGENVLENPRTLLEDIAVLHNRFSIDATDILPVSVISRLPNVRSEYYQVIDDIKNVLNIKCHTITLGSLCILMWHFKTLVELKTEDFNTVIGDTDLYPSLSQLIPDLPFEEPYPRAYRPFK